MPELTRACALCPKPFVTGDSVRQFADGFAHDSCIASWVTAMKKERQAVTPTPSKENFEQSKSPKKPVLAKALTEKWNQQVIIDNRGGAGGIGASHRVRGGS